MGWYAGTLGGRVVDEDLIGISAYVDEIELENLSLDQAFELAVERSYQAALELESSYEDEISDHADCA